MPQTEYIQAPTQGPNKANRPTAHNEGLAKQKQGISKPTDKTKTNLNLHTLPQTTSHTFFLILRRLLSKSLFTSSSFTLIYGTSATSEPISTLVSAKVYKKTSTNQNKGLLHNSYVQAVPLRALLRRKNTSAQSPNFTSSRFRPHSTIYTSITKTKGNHSLLTKAYTPSTNCPPVKRSQHP